MSLVRGHGAEVLHYRNKLGITPLQKAILSGFTAVACRLVHKLPVEALMQSAKPLQGPARLGYTQPRYWNTALATACEVNCVSVVEALLKKLPYKGISAANCEGGKTALFVAVEANSLDCARLLCDKLDVDDILARDKSGTTVLHMLAQTTGIEMLRLVASYVPRERRMEKNFDGFTPLHCATKPRAWIGRGPIRARGGPLGCGLEFYLEDATHEDLTCVGAGGATPLHCAVASGPSRAAMLLMRYLDDEDLTRTDERGRTPLHYVRHSNDAEVALEILGRVPYAMTFVDNDGCNPLHCLLGGFQGPTTELMVLHRVLQATPSEQLSAQNNNGDTPLHLCVSNSRRNWLRALLAYDVSDAVSVADRSGNNPLHLAACLGMCEALQTMVPTASREALSALGEEGLMPSELLVRANPDTAELAAALFRPLVKSAYL
eukprot:CAMPEP_0114606574 /NCGR_PEP_ID=MMETSP0168-20121206/1634_1 /TAXON_ID=95228 ORGANISM="Vannella sp., Strain DIVA3 517/6/12" /NCGR_SAMPLE_ID=MMETSP0168 /ASSEMBLY_ACC=CAM_ASM_000044 /LENGTH=433 /DNA_ID=CAMNT_0001817447 /DNA_START=51 /DNA_END=1352 /DNA_ORIENTATION=+